MATIRAYTTIEQSRKLAEILPLESADSCWTNHLFDSFLSSWRIESTSPKEHKSILDTFNVKGYLIEPAWSLAALLDVLPKSLIYTPNQALDRYCCKNIMHDLETYGENPIDACYEMLVKLNELNLL